MTSIHSRPVEFNKHLKLTEPITHVDRLSISGMIVDFDKDGFDLNPIEVAYYNQNYIPLQYKINRYAFQKDWLIDPFNGKSGVRVDHSITAMRLEYADRARDQVETFAKDYPLYNKLLQIKPKWGLDINLEYVFEDGFIIEMFHLEEDYRDYDEFIERVNVLANDFKQERDYDSWARSLRRMPNSNETSEYLNDYRARMFGYSYAYATKPVI